MPKCRTCKNLIRGESCPQNYWCDITLDSPDVDLERDCENYIPMTNADKIRQMTDEELAAIIMCPYDSDGENCKDVMEGFENCVKCTPEWLREKAGEN